jgi:hypothetical protein
MSQCVQLLVKVVNCLGSLFPYLKNNFVTWVTVWAIFMNFLFSIFDLQDFPALYWHPTERKRCDCTSDSLRSKLTWCKEAEWPNLMPFQNSPYGASTKSFLSSKSSIQSRSRTNSWRETLFPDMYFYLESGTLTLSTVQVGSIALLQWWDRSAQIFRGVIRPIPRVHWIGESLKWGVRLYSLIKQRKSSAMGDISYDTRIFHISRFAADCRGLNKYGVSLALSKDFENSLQTLSHDLWKVSREQDIPWELPQVPSISWQSSYSEKFEPQAQSRPIADPCNNPITVVKMTEIGMPDEVIVIGLISTSIRWHDCLRSFPGP